METPDQAAQRTSIQSQQDSVRQKIESFTGHLARRENRTLNDAKNLLSQSEAALKESDLQRSEILVHKASLLITALERNR
jgi:hypothetical protein